MAVLFSRQAKKPCLSPWCPQPTAPDTAGDQPFLKLFPPPHPPPPATGHPSILHSPVLSLPGSLTFPPFSSHLLFTLSLSKQTSISTLTPLPMTAFSCKLWRAVARLRWDVSIPARLSKRPLCLLTPPPAPTPGCQFVQLPLPAVHQGSVRVPRSLGTLVWFSRLRHRPDCRPFTALSLQRPFQSRALPELPPGPFSKHACPSLSMRVPLPSMPSSRGLSCMDHSHLACPVDFLLSWGKWWSPRLWPPPHSPCPMAHTAAGAGHASSHLPGPARQQGPWVQRQSLFAPHPACLYPAQYITQSKDLLREYITRRLRKASLAQRPAVP